jgi:GNAT superfamily N-acetyltransferase
MSDTIIVTSLDSPEAQPLVTELEQEYSGRYGTYRLFRDEDPPEGVDLFPPLVFEEPYGTLLLLQRDGESIAGGAFMYLDEESAEVKRVWTSSQHRRQGLSSVVMTALEGAARDRGYRNLYLTTGPRQPEAVGLYLKLGFTPLFDLNGNFEEIGHLGFEKAIAGEGDQSRDASAPSGVQLSTPEARSKAARQREAQQLMYRWRPRPPVRLADLSSGNRERFTGQSR